MGRDRRSKYTNFKEVEIIIEPNLIMRGTVYPCVRRDSVKGLKKNMKKL